MNKYTQNNIFIAAIDPFLGAIYDNNLIIYNLIFKALSLKQDGKCWYSGWPNEGKTIYLSSTCDETKNGLNKLYFLEKGKTLYKGHQIFNL